MTFAIPETSNLRLDTWDTDYISDNWEQQYFNIYINALWPLNKEWYGTAFAILAMFEFSWLLLWFVVIEIYKTINTNSAKQYNPAHFAYCK